MYSFKNDYSEGAHISILDALVKCNMIQSDGYGEDLFTQQAAALIKKVACNEDIDVHFLSGGTQTNLIAISSFLRPHEAVISANTGHILVHETGAIEATGHKIISVDVDDGKLTPDHILNVLDEHQDEHMVKPKLVFISNATEIGTIYTKVELENISKCCRDNNLYLYMDGARLGSALTSKDNDLTLKDLTFLVDSFYIGGTKNGALLGEALVISNDKLKEDFRYFIKQKGGLLAKGRVISIQFLELFKDNLYFELASRANNMAQLINEELKSSGYEFLTKSGTNQIFPIIPNALLSNLEKDFLFYVWKKIDENNSAIRIVTSWATDEKEVIRFIEKIRK